MHFILWFKSIKTYKVIFYFLFQIMEGESNEQYVVT